MKILKKGGSREKGGGGNAIHAPCACGSTGILTSKTYFADISHKKNYILFKLENVIKYIILRNMLKFY